MIVNAAGSVDKADFLHMLKGLPNFEAVEQGLCLAGTETGQKNGCDQVAWFRTFAPVDIHGLVHRADGFACCGQGRSRFFGRRGGVAGIGKFF